jgi:hypothetical protein
MSTDNILEKIGYLDDESHLGFDLLQMFTKFGSNLLIYKMAQSSSNIL